MQHAAPCGALTSHWAPQKKQVHEGGSVTWTPFYGYAGNGVFAWYRNPDDLVSQVPQRWVRGTGGRGMGLMGEGWH